MTGKSETWVLHNLHPSTFLAFIDNLKLNLLNNQSTKGDDKIIDLEKNCHSKYYLALASMAGQQAVVELLW